MANGVDAGELGLVDGVGERFVRDGTPLSRVFNICRPGHRSRSRHRVDLRRTSTGSSCAASSIDSIDVTTAFVLTDYKTGRSHVPTALVAGWQGLVLRAPLRKR